MLVPTGLVNTFFTSEIGKPLLLQKVGKNSGSQNVCNREAPL